MKLKYTKPMLAMEQFGLAQSIALGCDTQTAKPDSTVGSPSHWNKTECGWMIDGGLIVWVEFPQCTYPADENTPVNGLCYNNPDGGNTIFAS